MTNYANNNLEKPKYLFDGSPKMLDIIEPRQAHDANNNPENEDYAIFLTSSFLIASAYAFKDTIKQLSDGLKWDFDIAYDSKNNTINIKMDNVIINNDIKGYIYVFPFSEEYEHHGKSIQYKCHHHLKPIDIIEIKFSDFKKYYSINERTKKR